MATRAYSKDDFELLKVERSLTYAFSIGLNRGSSAAGFGPESSMGEPRNGGRVVNLIDNSGLPAHAGHHHQTRERTT